jgi:hypothetical protein
MQKTMNGLRACVLAVAAIFSGAVTPSPSATLVMKNQALHDDGLGMDAYSVLVPEGWKLQGSIEWMPVLPTPLIDISVANAATHEAWRQFPRISYVAGVRANQEAMFPSQRQRIEQQYAEGNLTPNGIEVREIPISGQQYVLKVLSPKLCPEVANARDIKVVSEEQMPGYAKAQAGADPFHRDFTSWRTRMTYTAADGPVEREWMVTIIMTKNDMGRFPATYAWMADATTWRAPAGKLDALRPTFTAIGSSVKPLLPWFNVETQAAVMFLQEQQKAQAKLLKDQRDAINGRMQILRDEARQASQQVSDQIRSNFAAQQAAKAQSQRQFMHYVNDTAAFRNPNDGSTVTLDAGYKYQFMSSNGDVLQTNDPTLQPPVDPKTSWKAMDRTND